MMKAGGVIELDLKASISATDLELLRSLVGSCRRLGMLFYPNMLARHGEADLPSFVWVSIEEVKRFGMALYKLCTKVSGLETDGSPLLHARELQFSLPSNDLLWHSVGRRDWEVNAKDVVAVSMKDDLQAKWISNFAEVIDSLGS
ncbi:hypothetical protein BDW74DRAFT_150927 [Aspergillus multicolor]|uniref:uncharacterized protein n=1 Tax=Aspergillus multicolor TaxID=41759 RepID=UPI003CCD91F8